MAIRGDHLLNICGDPNTSSHQQIKSAPQSHIWFSDGARQANTAPPLSSADDKRRFGAASSPIRKWRGIRAANLNEIMQSRFLQCAPTMERLPVVRTLDISDLSIMLIRLRPSGYTCDSQGGQALTGRGRVQQLAIGGNWSYVISKTCLAGVQSRTAVLVKPNHTRPGSLKRVHGHEPSSMSIIAEPPPGVYQSTDLCHLSSPRAHHLQVRST
ncbi:hypothetical protein QBC37DRAFT_460567 [Rhypophila decipiens]|uniref:Uncharacterized protein n=1 Tax=Rhypophila decipiens TaxID=261697 RepID=A0AAN6YDZ3_9PEZI|nr:hypothetical protein QBC37DRAFT_460567 [Rhypophila decipiens]